MNLEDLKKLAKEKDIDIEKLRLANNRIATISENSSGDVSNLPYGILKNGSGFVKFGKLIMPELTFRDEENYPYLTVFFIGDNETAFCIIACETKEKPEITSDSEVLFADTVEKRVHVCFTANATCESEEEQEVTFEGDKWYFCSPEDEILGEFYYCTGSEFYYITGNVAFDYDTATPEGEVLRGKDSIESLQGMDYMLLFPIGEKIETGLLKDYAKVGNYIEPPTEGMVTYGFILNQEYKFPTDEMALQKNDSNNVWGLLGIKNTDIEIYCFMDDDAAKERGVEEAGIYTNYLYSLLAYPVFLIIPSQTTDYLVKSNTLSNIANSIRDKLGTSAKMLLEDMPNAIKGIATVGDSITITWDGQATEEVYDSKYYKVSDLYFNGAQLSNATVTLTNGAEEVTGKFTDSRWYTGLFVTGSSGIAWGLDLMLFSTDGTNEDLGVSKGTYIGVIASGDYSGYWVSSITYPVTPNVLLQDKTITANGTYQADDGYNGFGKVTVDVASGGSSQTIVTTNSVTITNADVVVEDESTIVLGG